MFAIIIRLFFAWHQPFTNDEGAYLFDAKLLSEWKIPAGDVLTKAPVPALLFASSVWITSGSLFAARLVAMLLSTLTAIPLAWLAYRLHGKTAAMFTILLWLFTAPFSMQLLGITENVAIFFSVASLALWVEAITVHKRITYQWLPAVVAGVVYGLAFASRKTSIAILVPALFLWLLAPKKIQRQQIAFGLIGCLTILLPWIAIIYYIYGAIGVDEAIGIGYGRIWQQQDIHIFGQVKRNWALSVIWRVGTGISISFLLGLLWAIVKMLRGHLMPVLPLMWLLSSAGLYAGWNIFLPEYLIDFFAPIILIAALALADIWRHWQKRAVVIISIIAIASVASAWSAYNNPWTGMFTRKAANEAAAELRRQVPHNESILTAAVIIPYLSGHNVLFNIAHPLWYRYDFISSIVKETFLPPLHLVEHEIKKGNVSWALVEHLTDYTYLRHESRLIDLFGKQWKLVTSVPNNTGFRSNTLKIYRRQADVAPQSK